jgi:hypothetical protein
MRIKNWSHFQHFKDRRPPWIKLYRDILDDIQWHSLDANASKVLVMCWLIASESDGYLPDIKTLAFRLRMSEKDTKDCVIKLSHWVEQDDIGVISERYQDAIPETERETETEKRQRATPVAKPDGVTQSVWDEFVKHRKAKKAQITELVIEGLIKEAKKANWTLEDVLKETVFRNWQSFKAEWVAGKQNPADRVHVTVPGTTERDPALVKLDKDKELTKPPTLETLARLAALRRQA